MNEGIVGGTRQIDIIDVAATSFKEANVLVAG